MSKPMIPRNGAAIVDSAGRASREFHIFLLSLADAAGVDMSAELDDILRRIDTLEGASQSAAIRAVGSLVARDGILSLIGDADNPSGSSYYGSNAGGERGWWRVIDAISAGTGLAKAVPTDGYNVLGELDDPSQLPATSDINDAYLIYGDYWVWTGVEWDRVGPPSGEAVLSLAELPAAVGGTLQKITRDAYGRVSELAPAALADLEDISDDSPALGDMLQWDGAQWVPKSTNVKSFTSVTTLSPSVLDDLVVIAAQAGALSISNPDGTEAEGQGFLLRLKDNGTPKALTWGSAYRPVGGVLPAITTAGQWMYLPIAYNGTDGKWDVLFDQAGSAVWGGITGDISEQSDLVAALGNKAKSFTSTATVTPARDDDMIIVSAQTASLSIANPTGAAVWGDGFVLAVKDNGTSRALTWGDAYRGMGAGLSGSTVAGKWHYFPVSWNLADSKWDVFPPTVQQ